MSTLQLIPATGNPIDVSPDQKKLVVGRSVASDIVLDDASISRRHASIERREDGFFVTDLGSANGSFLDGARFEEEIQLRDGTELRLGSVKVKVRIVAEEGDSEATIMVDIDEVTGEMPAVPRRPGAEEDATASMPAVTAADEMEDLVRSPPPADQLTAHRRGQRRRALRTSSTRRWRRRPKRYALRCRRAQRPLRRRQPAPPDEQPPGPRRCPRCPLRRRTRRGATRRSGSQLAAEGVC